MTVHFQVSTHRTGQKRVVHIHVYDTIAEMDRARRRYDRMLDGGSLPIKEEDVWGWTQSSHVENVDDHGKVTIGGHMIHVRYVREHLGLAVLSHELAHAAIRIYRIDNGKGTENIENEEMLAHIFSDLCSAVNNKMYDKGLYSD
jgi:hypothetical protein